MLKNIKRITSLFLVALLVCGCVIPASVEASIIGGNASGVIPPEDSVVQTCRASQVSNEFRYKLEEIGVEMRADTIIQATPVSKNSDALALTVTNVNGPLVTQEVFISYDDNGVTQNVVSVNASGNIELEYGAKAVTIESAIRFIFTYNCYRSISYGYICQPISIQAMYMNNEYDVDSMEFTFNCKGYERTYPGLVDLSAHMDDYYVHSIQLAQSSPTLNRWYSATNPLRSDRVIEMKETPLNPVPLTIDYELVIDNEEINSTYYYLLEWLQWTLVLD